MISSGATLRRKKKLVEFIRLHENDTHNLPAWSLTCWHWRVLYIFKSRAFCPVYFCKSHAPFPAHNDSWMINDHHPRHRALPTISPMALRLTLPCEHQWGFNWHQSSGPALWRHFAPMITGSTAPATDRIRGPPKLPVDLWEGLGIGCPLGSTVDNRP